MRTQIPPGAEGTGSGPAWSEPGFQRLFDIMPHAVLLSDPAGRIALANARAESLFGYTRGELLAGTIEMLVPLRYRAGHSGFRALFFAEPESRPMGTGRDLHALRKDGREVPVEIGLTPVPTPGGTYVLSSIVDITERRRAEARFRIAVEASPNAMVMTDRSGVILLVNSQTETMFGYRRDELVGQPVEILVPTRFRPTHPASRAAFVAAPHARAMGAGRDLFALRKDGSEVPVEIGLNPIETNEGVMVLSAIIEITERKRSQDELARYARELERSNADLQEFAAVASHDLQEPLRKIAAFGELLRVRAGGSLDAESLDYIDRMQRAAARMAGLITSLLELSRVTSRAAPFARVPLADVVAEVALDLEHRLTETGGRLEVGLLPDIRADRQQMRQLFQNLIANALKFRDPTRSPVVRVMSQRLDDRRWMIEVTDNGIGFDEKYLDRMFKPFSRLNSTSAYEGSGMGLAICRKIAARHHGEITARSTTGVGSSFIVIIPERDAEGTR